MRFFSFLLLISVAFASCKNDNKTAPVAPKAKEVTKVAVSQEASKPGYPKLPKELVMKIWNEGEMIDYLFHNLPFSMSQDEQASIRTNLTYIGDEEVVSIPKSCKPMARQFYQVGGDIIMESDIYFSDNCRFYVFLIDGKEQYANQMNETGQNFMANIIQQAMKARQGIGQQQ